MPKAVHYFFGRCPELSGERPGVVPEVVKVQALEASRLGRAAPDESPPGRCIGKPSSLVKTRESGRGLTYVAKCSSSIAARVAGIVTARVPAADFGGPTSRSLPTVCACLVTMIVLCSKSMSWRSRANSSPSRKPDKAAVQASASYRWSLGLWLRWEYRSFKLGDDGFDHLEGWLGPFRRRLGTGPLIVQGLNGMTPSETASPRIVRRSR